MQSALLLVLGALSLVVGLRGLAHGEGEAGGHVVSTLVRKLVAGVSQPGGLQALLKEAALSDESVADEAVVCLYDVLRWKKGLENYEMWAMRMVDSTSKFITGVLYGNLYDLGNFDECVTSTPGTLGSGDDFTGRYALFSINVLLAANATLPVQSLQHWIPLGAGAGAGGLWRPLVALHAAVCAPSSCSARVLEAAAQASLAALNENVTARLGVRLEAQLPDFQTSLYSGWRQPGLADWLVGLLCAIVAVIVFLATFLDVVIVHAPGGLTWVRNSNVNLLLAFSAWTNGKRLFTVSDSRRDSFTCVNGIRFLSAMWVILGHRYRYGAEGVPFTNLITIPKRISENILITIVPSAIISVDTFFMMGGMVNAYAFMTTVSKTNSFNIFQFYMHRYIRLTPALLLIVAVTSTWYSLIGNGPLWYATVGACSRRCSTSWWTHLLYLANYVSPDSQCVITWYLMVDMQLYWLSPLALVPLWKCHHLGVTWVLALLAGSCAAPFALSWMYEFRAPVPLNIFNKVKQQQEMNMLYYPTHMRATSYLVGLLVGYYLYRYRQGMFTCRLKAVHLCVGWLLSATLCLSCVFGARPLFNILEHPYNKIESSFYIGFYRLAWSLGISWVVLVCVTGRGGPVNILLSWKPFAILGRLTYGIYLTHALVQYVDVGTLRSPEYYSDFKMIERVFSDACIATLLSIILTLFFESPISGMEKLLRSGAHHKKAKALIVETPLSHVVEVWKL